MIFRIDQRWVRRLSLLLVAGGTLVTALNASGAEPEATNELRRGFESVRGAVVRIALSEHGHSGTGTIVSSEGHIVLHDAPHLKDRALIVFLPNGRRAKGILLGWSSEWNVSLAKIVDEGPWPFVELESAPHTPKVNDPCFTVGYTLKESGWATSPEQRTGRITKTDQPRWFSSSIQGSQEGEPYFAYGPVFNAQGKLLGNLAVETVRGDSVQLHAAQIRALWPQLTEPGNVDKRRLFAAPSPTEAKRPYRVFELKSESLPEPSQIEKSIVACTVGLRKQHGSRWSGVIISPDGWITTCAHGGQTPGERVVVELSDGREANAQVTGANPISDIALVKITDKGPWPFAPFCETSDLKPDTPCWFAGYPSERKGRDPLLRKTKVVNPQESELSHLLYTDKAYSQSGGDSGGGVFDLRGRLLALNEGKEPDAPGRHPRVETIWVQWDSLIGSTSAK